MNEGKGNTILLTVIGIATLLIAVVGATFAYFTAILSGEENTTTITINSGTLGIQFDNHGQTIEIGTVDNIYPRTEAWHTKTFSVKGNTTTVTTIPYTLALEVTKNTFGRRDDIPNPGANISSGVLTFDFRIDAASSANGTKPAPQTATPIPINLPEESTVKSVPLGSGTFVGATDGEEVHTYHLDIFFKDTGYPNQNADQGREFSAYVSIVSP